VAVEIDANPWRLDLDWRWHRRALERTSSFRGNRGLLCSTRRRCSDKLSTRRTRRSRLRRAGEGTPMDDLLRCTPLISISAQSAYMATILPPQMRHSRPRCSVLGCRGQRIITPPTATRILRRHPGILLLVLGRLPHRHKAPTAAARGWLSSASPKSPPAEAGGLNRIRESVPCRSSSDSAISAYATLLCSIVFVLSPES
jgi:hypothetical protein